MQKKLILITVLLAASFWAYSQKLPVEVYKLANGLTVILQEDHRRPEVQGYVSVRAGSVNEAPDATGMAHYLEHVMFKGTQDMGTVNWEKEKPHYDKIIQLYDELGQTTDKKKREAIQLQINEESLKAAEYAVPNELQRLVDEIGGTGLNASTSYDYTQYMSKFPSSQIERWLTLYCHLFEKPVFRSFQAELETIYEEYNMYSDRSQSRIQEETMQAIFKKTPYGRDVIGLPEHLKNPSLNRLQEFFKTYYVPGNMALILSGDFDPATVKPLIEQLFGKWETVSVAAAQFEEEAPFKGREFLELKMGPQEMITLNFRTVSMNHEDDMILDICSVLLNNGQSGLLDQLSLDGKVLQALGGNHSFRNGGVFTFSIIPNPQEFYDGPSTSSIASVEDYKAVMREMDRAKLKAMPGSEKMVLEQIENLKNGNFADWQLESVKQRLISSYQRQQESVGTKAALLSNYFANGISIDEYVNYVDRVKKITKDDVLRVARKYLGNNFLAVYVKPGSLKKNAIDKPEYKPLVFPNADAISAFATNFSAIKTPKQQIHYIDVNTDVQKSTMTNGNTFYYTKNPVNDLFSLIIRYEVGENTIKELKYASILNYAGAAARDAKSLKGQFARINCTYSLSVDDNYTYVSLSGPEENLRQAMTYLNMLLTQPSLPQNQVARIAQSERIGRAYEKEEASAMADALSDYVMYGQKSEYIDRMSIKNLMNLKATDIITAFKFSTEYAATIFYTGVKSAAEIKPMIEQAVQFVPNPKKGTGYQVKDKQDVKENTVYFINSSSLQAQVSFFANGKPYVMADAPQMTAFNNYFSGGFTGLIMQEIREYRSLAYGAGGGYYPPSLPGKPCWFSGFIQTQDDKTAYAVGIYMDLIKNMPQKTDRMEVLKQKLILSSATTRPDFRSLGMTVEGWQRMGYTDDPLKSMIPAYETLAFTDIVNFEKNYVKDQPMAIMIVGDKKRIDLKSLAKQGKVVELKIADIVSKDEE